MFLCVGAGDGPRQELMESNQEDVKEATHTHTHTKGIYYIYISVRTVVWKSLKESEGKCDRIK